MEFQEFVEDLRRTIDPLIGHHLPTKKNKNNKREAVENLKKLLKQPKASGYLHTLSKASQQDSPKLITPKRIMGYQALWITAAQALTSIYHSWTLDRKDHFNNWEDPVPIWAGGGPDLFWRERIEDHGLALLLGIGAGAIHLLHRRLSQKEDLNLEFEKYKKLIPMELEGEEKINNRGLKRVSKKRYNNLGDLLADINNNAYEKPEKPELAQDKISWKKIGTNAGVGALVGIAHGALHYHSGSHHDIQTLIKNLCCCPADSHRERFFPDMMQYLQTTKPLIWASIGATIANTPPLFRQGLYRVKSYLKNDNKKS